MSSIENLLSRFFEQEKEVLDWSLVNLDENTQAPSSEHYKKWIQEQKHGSMDFMERTQNERLQPGILESNVKCLVLFLVRYPKKLKAYEPQTLIPQISSYAQGFDYHKVIYGMIGRIKEQMDCDFPGVILRPFADSSPVFERDWAAEAGLGWRAKNTCLISQKHGSGFFIGGFFLSQELNPFKMPSQDFCGKCTRCIDACPTQALENGSLDARKCISYKTIEDPSPFGLHEVQTHEAWVFGCDICQQVCPWNYKHLEVKNEFSDAVELTLDDWLRLLQKGGGFKSQFGKSPMMRAGRKKMMRNIFRLAVTQKRTDLIPLLSQIIENEDDVVLKSSLSKLLELMQ